MDVKNKLVSAFQDEFWQKIYCPLKVAAPRKAYIYCTMISRSRSSEFQNARVKKIVIWNFLSKAVLFDPRWNKRSEKEPPTYIYIYIYIVPHR